MASPDDRSATFTIETPTSAPGAVAIVRVAGDVERACEAMGFAAPAIGHIVLRSIAGVDTGLVARWSEDSVHVMPHGGPAILRRLAARLIELGFRQLDAGDLGGAAALRAEYPEATSDLEARMLAALALAASPLAIDLLLAQPRRWATPIGSSDAVRDRTLRRLIDPPLVVAIGPPNVGKSTLCNALAGRAVSLVADVPGTTRDHVGVTLDLAGLVVRYVDAPGLRESEDAIETQAAKMAIDLAAHADLLLVCGDCTAAPTVPAELAGLDRMIVALREDLGHGAFEADVRVGGLASTTPQGLEDLVAALRERLVPQTMIESPAPWRFW
ncbi:MAG: 50S ribosome-binding GTPase [Planctomycetes bacterium]|nr:50S ribosome-binding GTPase [Planctomycetota bacterium]